MGVPEDLNALLIRIQLLNGVDKLTHFLKEKLLLLSPPHNSSTEFIIV